MDIEFDTPEAQRIRSEFADLRTVHNARMDQIVNEFDAAKRESDKWFAEAEARSKEIEEAGKARNAANPPKKKDKSKKGEEPVEEQNPWRMRQAEDTEFSFGGEELDDDVATPPSGFRPVAPPPRPVAQQRPAAPQRPVAPVASQPADAGGYLDFGFEEEPAAPPPPARPARPQRPMRQARPAVDDDEDFSSMEWTE